MALLKTVNKMRYIKSSDLVKVSMPLACRSQIGRSWDCRPRAFAFAQGLILLALVSIFSCAASKVFGAADGDGVDIRATAQPQAVDPGGVVNYTIQVTVTGEGDVQPPVLNRAQDFNIISTSTSQSSRSVFVSTPNGPKFTMTRTVVFDYSLQPTKEGNLRIRASEVVVSGKRYQTPELTVRVAKGAGGNARARPKAPPGFGGADQDESGVPPGWPQPPTDEEDDMFTQLLRRGLGQMPQMPGQGLPGSRGGRGGGGAGNGAGASRTFPVNPNDAFFIQVEADKTEAYVGEQITVSWYLYTRGTIREIDTLKYPSLKGFWKEDIEMSTTLNFSQEVVNGIPYRKALLASFAIFPIKEGQAMIDSYTAKCTVVSADDIMAQFGVGKAYTYTKSSQPLKVLVKPLPTEGRPADFSGAVGEYQVSARIDDRSVVEHQPFSLKIRFDGRGNAKTIDMPPFQLPDGLEQYDLQKDAKFLKSGTSYKEFNMLLIPRRSGEFIIPPIAMSVFDPVSRKYISKQTDTLRFTAGKGSGAPGMASSSGANSGAGKGSGTGSAKSAHSEPALVAEYTSRTPMTRAQTSVGFGGLFIGIFLTLLWRAREELGWGEKKRDLLLQVQNRIKKARVGQSAGDWRRVGVELTNATSFVLGQTVGEAGANVPFEDMLKKAPPSIRRELAEPLRKLHEQCQILCFAPEAAVGKMRDPESLKDMIASSEKILIRAVALASSAEHERES
jgi:hypothetical protein